MLSNLALCTCECMKSHQANPECEFPDTFVCVQKACTPR